MIKLSKAYVLILAALLLPFLASTATAAFAFSVPSLSIVAGPGLGGGPTVFNTFSHDLTTLSRAASADAAANALATPSFGQSCGVVPGFGGLGCGPCGAPCGFGPFFGPSAFAANPVAADQIANQQACNQAVEDNTFATSFATEGLSPFSGLCNACISGNAPQQFTLQFF